VTHCGLRTPDDAIEKLSRDIAAHNEVCPVTKTDPLPGLSPDYLEMLKQDTRYVRNLETLLKAYEDACPEPPAVKQVRQKIADGWVIVPGKE
jgi:hypothetical protein